MTNNEPLLPATVAVESVIAGLPLRSQDAARDASAAYDAIVYAHSLSSSFERVCECGREFRTSQAMGLHLGAVSRQADKAFSAAWDAVIAAGRAR